MFDVIVVGARCAGSPTAMLLAQRGYRVLLVDRAEVGSDLPMSTHLIWPAGVDRLAAWGLVDAVAEHCPAIPKAVIDFGPFRLQGSFPAPGAGRPAVCHSPRRFVLDRLLAEAAVKAGAELRDRFTVEELVFDGERVVGIRGSDAAGTTVTERSRLVVGADGPNSLVARLAAAPEYDVHPPIDSACWSYWSGPALDEAVEFYPREYRCCWGWRTGDGLALVGANWPIDEFHVLGRDPEAEFLAVVEAAAPDLAAGLREGRRAERWHRGFLRNFFRRPFGPGWALVGDAGYTKTAFTAEGITDAFHDAERVATAIDAGLSGTTPMKAALAAAEQQRNQAVKPFYDFSRDLAAMHPPTPELAAVFAALVGNQPETDRLCGVFAQLISPAEFFAPDNVGRILQAVGN